MTVKMYRPYAIVHQNGNLVSCGCGTQYTKSNRVFLSKESNVSCPVCGLRAIEVSKDKYEIWGTDFGHTVTRVGGLQPCPEPKDGFITTLIARQAYPAFYWAGVTEKGNFKISLRYEMHTMSEPKGKDAEVFDIEKANNVSMFRYAVVARFSYCNVFGGRNRETWKVSEVVEYMEKLCEDHRYEGITDDEKATTLAYLIENILPHIGDDNVVFDYLNDPTSVQVAARLDGKTVLYSYGFIYGSDIEQTALAQNQKYFMAKQVWVQTFVFKKDGRIFVLDENPERYRDLWATDRKAFYKAKARSKRFQFRRGDDIFNERDRRDIPNNQRTVNLTDDVLTEVERIYNEWLGSDYHLSREGRPLGINNKWVVQCLFDHMIIHESNASSVLVGIARMCGASNYKIIKNGPLDSVYTMIASRVKRKAFRRDLTALANELLSNHDARPADLMSFINICGSLGRMANHGFAMDLYNLINNWVKGAKDTFGGFECVVSEDSARNFVTAIEYLDEFVSIHKIFEWTHHSLYRSQDEGPFTDRYEYKLSDICEHSFDTARSIERLIEMGVDLDAIKNEIDRAGDNWRTVHNHIAGYYRSIQATRKDEELAKFELNDWQSCLADENVDGFDFIPEHPVDLHMVGSRMSICVGMYARWVARGEKTIVTMRKHGENEYHACLEINGNGPKETGTTMNPIVVQAKLSNNRPIVNDPDAIKALRTWMHIKRVPVHTADCKE